MSQGEDESSIGKPRGSTLGREYVPRTQCQHCGGMFYCPPSLKRRGGGKFCSKACYGSAKVSASDTFTRTCRRCSSSFTKLKKDGISGFCDWCRELMEKKKESEIRHCNLCGGEISNGNLLFCGNECYWKHRAASIKPRPPLEKNSTCVKCGSLFYASPGHRKIGWGSYCSLKCRPLNKRSRGKGGTRDDLGIYVRSSWEANYARYLNWLLKQGQILKWQYEPDTFEFPVKRGCKFYTPDFKVFDRGGSFAYHEIKGYMDQKSATKLKRMKIHYPGTRMIVIANKEMRELQKKVGALIPNWERNQADKLGGMRLRR